MSISPIYVSVDLDKLGLVVGERGRTKKEIERIFKVDLKIDSTTGEILISPISEETTPNDLMKARDVIRAISLGFKPEIALKLSRDDYLLEVINLKDYARSRSHLNRIKGRIIGEKGKSRKMIEELTGVDLSIGEHTVAIIGDFEAVRITREAVLMLIEGRQHATVYKFLQQEKRRRRYGIF